MNACFLSHSVLASFEREEGGMVDQTKKHKKQNATTTLTKNSNSNSNSNNNNNNNTTTKKAKMQKCKNTNNQQNLGTLNLGFPQSYFFPCPQKWLGTFPVNKKSQVNFISLRSGEPLWGSLVTFPPLILPLFENSFGASFNGSRYYQLGNNLMFFGFETFFCLIFVNFLTCNKSFLQVLCCISFLTGGHHQGFVVNCLVTLFPFTWGKHTKIR